MRKRMLSIAAAVALGTAMTVTGAMAADPPGPPPPGPGAPPPPGGGPPPPPAPGPPPGPSFGPGFYDYGGPCLVHRWVWTPFGWRWRLVDEC
jgi:hypothetical protein